MSTTVKKDSGIGQQFEKISQNVDVISPMVYPSTTIRGLAIDSPNAPFELLTNALGTPFRDW
jgi:hypothetical protein